MPPACSLLLQHLQLVLSLLVAAFGALGETSGSGGCWGASVIEFTALISLHEPCHLGGSMVASNTTSPALPVAWVLLSPQISPRFLWFVSADL